MRTEQEIRDFTITDILNIVLDSPCLQLLVDLVQHRPLLGSPISSSQEDHTSLPAWTWISRVRGIRILFVEDAEGHH